MRNQNYVAKPDDGCAWVTGASSGIGKELALDLARSGWTVAVTARSSKDLEALSIQAQNLPGSIHPYPGDVSDTQSMSDICKSILAGIGKIALMIANAGVYLPQDGLKAEAAAFKKSFDVNLMGTVNVLLPVIEVMKPEGRGQIAVVSSVAGYSGLPTSAAYGATKAGLINLAESLKFDLDRAGIRIQVVNPGFVDTPATRSNPFPMPHLLTVEQAVQKIREGLEDSKRFEIAFPTIFVLQLKFLKLLPYRLYFAFMSRATGWNKKKAG
ncbi:SDR family NAD(P)-dependent oxidoreductase [Roseibium porphyridii]|uniref:SDR family NAD(P)-dependent oxidoreductase n=1 Tax=Roseibium porphyridii TaxID=2866279 RepID=A0ABY8EXI4_9HYPH|nr:SDR family NAD(P)-dependent oxidoreductase [Roseibium sp. KMA01]WFE87732.1 SDR family NAD(P)-dependent oxidoreductase [Roseibium sp. KMA01]